MFGMRRVTTVGLDLAANLLRVHGADARGRPVLRREPARGKVLEFFADPPMPPRYVKTDKHDAADAETVREAVRRPAMRFVPAKGEDRQASLMPHRVREQLPEQRTATVNALRSHLTEFGTVAAQGRAS